MSWRRLNLTSKDVLNSKPLIGISSTLELDFEVLDMRGNSDMGPDKEQTLAISKELVLRWSMSTDECSCSSDHGFKKELNAMPGLVLQAISLTSGIYRAVKTLLCNSLVFPITKSYQLSEVLSFHESHDMVEARIPEDNEFLILSHRKTAPSMTVHSWWPRVFPPLLVLVCLPDSNAEWCTEANSHECPVS